MSRGLSAAAKNYTGPMFWAAKITLRDASEKFYAQAALVFLGQAYEPYLGAVDGVSTARGLEPESSELELLNADLTIGKLLETKAFEGATCELKQLLLGIEEAAVFSVGTLTEEEQSAEAARFRLVSRLDLAPLRLPFRDYMQICSLRYKFGSCESVSALPTCDKDFASCKTRVQEHRFDGAPTLTPRLVTTVRETPGSAPGGVGGIRPNDNPGGRLR